MLFRSIIVCLFLTASFLGSQAQETFPHPDWEDDYNPMASPDAEIGGKISVFAHQYPKSFNAYLENLSTTIEIFSLMYEPLLNINPLTLEFEPGIARSCELSKDKKTFTFYLDPKAQWSDGKPITAHDVAWTYEAIRNPKHLTGPRKIALERFETPVIIDEHTIQFTASKLHWSNLLTFTNIRFPILPKHSWQEKDFNKINFEFPVTSGLYKFGELKENTYLRMERRDDWWNKDAKRNQGLRNFQTIEYRFYSDDVAAYQAFKKGEIDFFAVYRSHRWIKETEGTIFDKNWVIKQAIYNHAPQGFQGFSINTRLDKFKDVRVRKAIAHLVDRRKMNRTIMHNQYFMLNSFYPDLYNTNHPNPHQLYEFDKDKAKALLAEAGWKVNGKTGKLEKDGEPFVIDFLSRSSSNDKFLVIVKEDLLDVGIELKIQTTDIATWSKQMDEFDYEMTWSAWGASIWKDPESLWSSKEATRTSGNNYPGIQNEKVDTLIEKQKDIFDINERNQIYRTVDNILYEEVPYVLLWSNNHTRLLYWNKFGTIDSVLTKYGQEESFINYSWLDYDSEADLAQAQKDNASLPGREFKVEFDQAFNQ